MSHTPQNPVRTPPTPSLIVLAAVVFGMITATRFNAWASWVWMGDDLIVYWEIKSGRFLTGLWQALGDVFADKFRPVAWVYLRISSVLFGKQIEYYIVFNIFLHVVNSCLFLWAALLLSGRRWIVSLFAALAFCWSRFGLFEVGQATGGPVEAFALLFFLLSLSSLLMPALGYSQRPRLWLAVSVIASFLMIYSHERYFGVLPVFAIAVFLLPGFAGLGRPTRAVVSVLFVLIAASNILVKPLVLGMPFLVGTGGSELGFDLGRTVEHTVQAVVSVLGFNYGPWYLAGMEITSLPAIYMVVAALVPLGAIWAIGSVFFYKEGRSAAQASWHYPVLLVALAGVLLLPPVSTIRLEQRWLLAPFGLFLLVVCWSAGVATGRRLVARWVPVAVVCIGSIVVDQMMSPYLSNVFFVSSTRVAEAAKREFVDGASSKVNPILLVLGEDHCGWTLHNGSFFRLYGRKARTVICAPTLSAAEAARPSPDTPIFEYREKAGFVRTTRDLPKPPRIVAFGPNPVTHGEPFNVQPTGESALWLKLQARANADSVVVLNGTPLKTVAQGRGLGALVPASLFAEPGTFALRVDVPAGDTVVSSDPVNFVVR